MIKYQTLHIIVISKIYLRTYENQVKNISSSQIEFYFTKHYRIILKNIFKNTFQTKSYISLYLFRIRLSMILRNIFNNFYI